MRVVVCMSVASLMQYGFVLYVQDGRLVAKPLSNDQTPYRKDERERIKKTGARILSMDQIEGLEPVHENWGDLNLGALCLLTSLLSVLCSYCIYTVYICICGAHRGRHR